MADDPRQPDDWFAKQGIKTIDAPTPPAQQGYWESFWELAHPKVVAEGLTKIGEWMMNPAGAGVEIGRASRAQLDQGKLLGAVPVIGPPAQKAADQLRAGNYRGAAGTVTGLVAPAIVGEVIPAARNLGRIESKNPAVAQAVRTALKNEVPLGPADMGLRGLGRLGYMTDAGSFLGIVKDWSMPVVEAFELWGQRLLETQRPGAKTNAEMAGASVTSAERSKLAGQAAKQNTAYDTVREIAERHVETRPVERVGADGKVEVVDVPMAAPVDLRPVKVALAPELARLKRLLTDAQKQNQPGYNTIRNIVDGPDYMPLDDLLEELSAVGEKQRGTKDAGLRTKGQGRAAFAWGKLDQALSETIGRLGPDAAEMAKALAAGKAATKAKYATAAELKRLGQTGDLIEPATAYARLTRPGDKSIGLLTRVLKNAPGEATNIGRAWLEERIARSFRHGDVDHTRAMLKEWEDLGPKTKELLYPDPSVRGQIADFMVSLKTWAESPNPSGTGAINAMMQAVKPAVRTVTGGTVGAISLPALAAEQLALSGGNLALHSTRLAKMLTEGITTPRRGPLRAVGIAGEAGIAGSQAAATPAPTGATIGPDMARAWARREMSAQIGREPSEAEIDRFLKKYPYPGQ